MLYRTSESLHSLTLAACFMVCNVFACFDTLAAGLISRQLHGLISRQLAWYLVNVPTENKSRDTIPLTVLLKSTRNFWPLSAPPGNPKWCRLHACSLKMAPFLSAPRTAVPVLRWLHHADRRRGGGGGGGGGGAHLREPAGHHQH